MCLHIFMGILESVLGVDEPTANLGGGSAEIIRDYIDEAMWGGWAVIIALHWGEESISISD